MSIVSSIVATFTRKLLGMLPACVRDIAISWHKSLYSTVDEGDTYPYVKDSIGTRTDTVYYGQYLDATSGQINFLRTSGIFDYTDPSDGALIEGVSIPVDGLYTIPANGICDIGIYPREVNNASGLLDFDGDDDAVSFSNSYSLPSSGFIGFRCYLKKESGYNIGNNQETIIIFGLEVANNRNAIARMYDDKIIFILPDGSGGWNRYYYSIIGLSLTILDIKFTWSGYLYSSLSINGSLVTPTLDTLGGQLSGETLRIGYMPSAGYLFDCLVWGININNAHYYNGSPDGNLDTAWVDTIGSINGTVLGSPTTIDIGDLSESEVIYTSFYPICETAGTVLHDTENGFHISVDAPSWSEELYGSDYLNQNGYANKSSSDSEGYDWTTSVDGTPISLNDNTLIPLKKKDSLAMNTLDAPLNFNL